MSGDNDTDDRGTEHGGGQGKNRSPNYPAIGLETALKWARKVYDAEKKSATSPTIIAQHCGYSVSASGLSGAARVSISALKKFGLLVGMPDNRLRVSDDAVKVFLQPDEGERLKTIQSLALKPQIIKDILAQYPEGLPSDDSLKYNLVTQLGFMEDGAGTFLKAMKETITFAKLQPDIYNVLMSPVAQPLDEQRNRPQNQAGFAPNQHRNNAPASALTTRLELSDGVWVNIEPSGPLTADTIDEIVDYLTLYKKRLAKRAAASPADGEEKS